MNLYSIVQQFLARYIGALLNVILPAGYRKGAYEPYVAQESKLQNSYIEMVIGLYIYTSHG